MLLTFARTLASSALLAVFIAVPALAEPEASPSPEPSEIARVFTSDRQSEPLRAAARSTYIVTKEQMLRRGARTVADALDTVPGLTIERYGASGTLADVFVRGSSSGQVLVLLDGRPVGGTQSGTVDLGQMPTTGIERIEVVEGSGATLYGTGAIGGVINLLTSLESRIAPRVTLRSGSLNERALTVETSHFTFERRVAGNAFAYPSFGPNAAGTRTNSDIQLTAGTFRMPFSLGSISAEASAGLRQQHLGVPGPTGFESPTSRQNTTDANALLALHRTRGSGTTSLEFSGTHSRLNFFADPKDQNGCMCSNVSDESRVQASLRHVVAGERSRFLVGVDLARGLARIDAGDGAPPVKNFAQTALYAQESLQVGATRLYAGLRGERDGAAGGSISPAFGAIARVSPSVTLRGNFATAFRAPTILDLYYPGYSNPALRPERTRSGDLTLASDAVLGGLSLGWFFTHGTDLIASNSDFTSLINVSKASIGGFTADLKTPRVRGFAASLGMTDLYRALDLTSTATRLPRRPVFTVNTGLEYLASGSRAGVASAGILAHSVGARSKDAAAAAFTRTDAYLRVRLTSNALLSLRSYNLGNERYAEVPGFPAPGRTFTIDLATR